MPGHLVVRSSGGMSNRLQAVICGVAYALLSGRTLHVDWRDGLYSDDLSNTFPRYFSLHGVAHAETLPAGTIHPAFWADKMDLPLAVEYLFEDNRHMDRDTREMTSIDFSVLDYPQDVLVCWSPSIRPMEAMLPALKERVPGFAGLDLDGACHKILREHIRVSPDVAEAVRAFKASRFKPSMIGAHIRCTDLRSPLEAFCRKLLAMTGGEAGIFLCTDNIHVQRTFSRLLGSVVCTEKYLPASGEPLHGVMPGVSSVRKGIEALIDLYLLAECDTIVRYARSSFTEIPRLYAGLPPERVVVINDGDG